MHRISDEQRRTRLGRRHLLAPSVRADSPVAAADAVVALHATDAATVFLAACARLTAPRPSARTARSPGGCWPMPAAKPPAPSKLRPHG
ncbi:hypothetical protein QFZ67_003903 [Streptomyces sp. V1I1]|nr:hypothetical protein [Streptomyces sp. V1I1]